MDGQMITQGALLLRSVIDVAKAVGSLVPGDKKRDEIPVYRLVGRDEFLRARADRATDITPWRWQR
jgi:hypothetical protein